MTLNSNIAIIFIFYTSVIAIFILLFLDCKLVARTLIDRETMNSSARIVDKVRLEGSQIVAEGMERETGHLLVPHSPFYSPSVRFRIVVC